MPRIAARLAALALLVAPGSAAAFDPWTPLDTTRQAAVTFALAVDWAQTRSGGAQGYRELNPVLGPAPSPSAVNGYFLAIALAHAGVARVLPRPYREAWQYILIGVEGHAAARNWNAGVRIRF